MRAHIHHACRPPRLYGYTEHVYAVYVCMYVCMLLLLLPLCQRTLMRGGTLLVQAYTYMHVHVHECLPVSLFTSLTASLHAYLELHLILSMSVFQLPSCLAVESSPSIFLSPPPPPPLLLPARRRPTRPGGAPPA
eukprot:GHVU01026638.1.p1 GENE.GHVU01026638.1~~GHVU01026638.1.p1  ORF type:complete len:135 (-),score=10.16 GHVU01026638.1:8-412(-)